MELKLTIEGRELKLSTNGLFIKKYCEEFDDNLVVTLSRAIGNKDLFSIAKLMYSALDEESRGDLTFEAWLESFKSPLFILPVMDRVIEFLIKDTTPTVESNGGEDSKKRQQ